MQVRELGNRVWQIYAFTIFVGTVITIIGIGLILLLGGWTQITSINPEDIFNVFMSFLLSVVIAAIVIGVLGLPNIVILNLGLQYIYKTVKNKEERNRYFIYLWLVLFAIPLLILFFFIGRPSLIDLGEGVLMPLPYVLSLLYYLFKINNKYDKIYPLDFSRNQKISVDILDDDF